MGEGEGEGVEGGGACGGARIMHGGTGGGGGHGEGGDHKGDRTEGCSERDDVSDGCCSALAAGSREDTTMLLIMTTTTMPARVILWRGAVKLVPAAICHAAADPEPFE